MTELNQANQSDKDELTSNSAQLNTQKPIKTDKPWSTLLLESLMVLIGVLAAFIIEEWREDYQRQQEVDLAKVRIIEEIKLNYSFLQNFKMHVDDRFEKIRAMAPLVDNSKPFTELRHHFVGYRFVQFQSSAWERANANQLANHLEEDFLIETQKLYNWNDTLTKHNNRIDMIRFTSHFYDPNQATIAYEMSKSFIGQQVDWARGMTALYQNFYQEFLNEQPPEFPQDLEN